MEDSRTYASIKRRVESEMGVIKERELPEVIMPGKETRN